MCERIVKVTQSVTTRLAILEQDAHILHQMTEMCGNVVIKIAQE